MVGNVEALPEGIDEMYKIAPMGCWAGDVEALPEGSQRGLPDLNHFRIRPTAYEPEPYGSSAPPSRRVTFDGLPAPAADEELEARGASRVVSLVTGKGASEQP